MHVEELWRYPVKSLAGEKLEQVEVRRDGFQRDREVVVVSEQGRMVTARTKPHLLSLRGTSDAGGGVFVDGHPWDSPEAMQLVQAAAGAGTRLVRFTDPRRFDVLPLSVATSGAIAHMGVDRRRFRPNLILGAVDGLAERQWEGKRIRIGAVEIEFRQLRGRCVMTTYDPDTQAQDLDVLRRIVREFDGTFSLDSAVITPGMLHVGDRVELL